MLLLRRAPPPRSFAPVGDSASNRAAAQKASGSAAAGYCIANGGDASSCAIVGSVASAVVGGIWDGAVSIFSTKDTYDCTFFSENWPDVPLSPEEQKMLPPAMGAAVKAAADVWAQQNYQTWDQSFQNTANGCFPALGSMYEGVRVLLYRRAIVALKKQQAAPKRSLAVPLALGAGAVGLGVWAWKAGLFK